MNESHNSHNKQLLRQLQLVAGSVSLKSYVANHSCTLAYSRFHPSSSRRSYCRRHLRTLERKIRKFEYQLKLNCEETTAQQSQLSLKQIRRRVERIERHLKKQSQQAKVKLSICSCVCTSHMITINIYFLSTVDGQK